MTLEEAKEIMGGEIVDLDGVRVLRTQFGRRMIDITEELLRDIVLMPNKKCSDESQEAAKVTR